MGHEMNNICLAPSGEALMSRAEAGARRYAMPLHEELSNAARALADALNAGVPSRDFLIVLSLEIAAMSDAAAVLVHAPGRHRSWWSRLAGRARDAMRMVP
jgi:hypothetical protein